jgi:hypothetical protein
VVCRGAALWGTRSGESYRSAAGEVWLEAVRIVSSASILSHQRSTLYMSHQLLLFSCPTNITGCIVMWPCMPEDHGLNISSTELL